MTRSIGRALSWEYWRRGMFWFVPASAGLTVGCLALLSGLSPERLHVGPQLSGALTPFLVMMPLILAFASWKAPRRLYALPVSTATLTVWSLANGALACAGMYGVTGWALNGVFHADWPLVVPALLAVSAYLMFQGGLWWLGSSDVLISVVFAAGWIAIIAAAGRWHHFGADASMRLPRVWAEVSLGPAAAWLGVVVASGLLAWNGLARDRRGDAWSLAWLARGCSAAFGGGWRRSAVGGERRRRGRQFRSAASAQFWLEWRSKGRLVPLGVAGMTLVLGSCTVCFVNPWDVESALSGFTGMFILLSPLVGVFLGSSMGRFDMPPFAATRPAPDDVFARAVLGSVAAAVVLSAAICLIGNAAPRLLLEPAAVRRMWAAGWTASHTQSLVLMILLVLTSWTLCGLGSALALAGQRFVAWGGVGAVGVLFTLGCVGKLEVPLLAMSALTAFFAACFFGTIAAFIAARRRRLISGLTIAASLTGHAVLYAWACAMLPGAAETFAARCVCIAVCAAPFAPLAAAPLAVWRNRHR